MGSRTVWQRVYDDPDDDRVWDEFTRHYLTPVYAWACRAVGPANAGEVTNGVFIRLHRRIRSPADRVAPSPSGSYRGYVAQVFRSATSEYFKSLTYFPGRAAVARKPLSDGVVGGAPQPPDLDDLEAGVMEFAGYEAELDRYDAAYRAAAAALRAGPQFDGRAFGVFLRIYAGHREAGLAAAIDREVGWSRGLAGRHARQFRDRVLEHMKLPPADDTPDGKRSENILTLMVLRHGDPS